MPGWTWLFRGLYFKAWRVMLCLPAKAPTVNVKARWLTRSHPFQLSTISTSALRRKRERHLIPSFALYMQSTKSAHPSLAQAPHFSMLSQWSPWHGDTSLMSMSRMESAARITVNMPQEHCRGAPGHMVHRNWLPLAAYKANASAISMTARWIDTPGLQSDWDKCGKLLTYSCSIAVKVAQPYTGAPAGEKALPAACFG